MTGENTTSAVGGLTSAQRFHFDVYGYVLLENALTSDEVDAMKAALYRLRADDNRSTKRVYHSWTGTHAIKMGNLVACDPALLHFATHPKLIPCIEEVVGGTVRLEESEAIINSRNPSLDLAALHVSNAQGILPTGFHTGTRHGWGTWLQKEKFHCLFVKTLAYLTDVGPGDGGTAVIPGSHKMGWDEQEMIAAAVKDPGNLIRQIEAPAGSVLLFGESLIHSTTEILTENERVILVSGYTPPMLREWPGNEPDSAFAAALPDRERNIITGEESWNWKRR